MLVPFSVIKAEIVIPAGAPTKSQLLAPGVSSNAFTYLLYVISPSAVPSTIKEEKAASVEFKVTVPVLVKSPETVREEVSSIVKVLPVVTITVLATACVPDIIGSLLKGPSKATISLLVGTAPVLQFNTSAQSLLVVPVQ